MTAGESDSESAETHNTPTRLVCDFNASEVDYSQIPMSGLWSLLESSPVVGLTESQVEARLERYGPNQLESTPPPSIWKLIGEQFDDRLVQILLCVAVLSGVFSYFEVRQELAEHSATTAALWKSFAEPAVILTILVLNAAVGVWQSQSASDSIAALKELQPRLATVLRDNDSQQLQAAEVPASCLVPGDIIQVRVGDRVPADARLISLSTAVLSVDEGSLTGESTTVSKLPGDQGIVLGTASDSSGAGGVPIQDQRGMLFSGTVVTSGTGRAVVVATGADTQLGRIQQGVTDATQSQPKTPLATKLDEFGQHLTVIIAVICLGVWVVSIPKMNDPTFGGSFLSGAIHYAKVAVALGVAAIPEGLPAVITLCLSLGTRRMAQRKVVVRQLPSVETLGCTSVICTDKTGTLTTNEMTVVSLVLLENDKVQEHIVKGLNYSPDGFVDDVTYCEEVQSNPIGSVAEVAQVAALCNDADIVGHEQTVDTNTNDEADTTGTFERIGEPTEAALCVLVEKLGGLSPRKVDTPIVRANAHVTSWRKTYPRVATLEFNRDRKSMSVLCATNQRTSRTNKLFVKGAPNLLLARCTRVKFRDGTVKRLSGSIRREIEAKLSEMAARPLRCLALAIKDDNLESSLSSLPKDDHMVAKHPLLSNPSTYNDIESGLTLVGIVGIKDPARPEVAQSIKDCSAAGIRVIMITGDARDTAVAIAKEVCIFDTDADDSSLKAFEGREFFLKPEDEQLRILKSDNIVFCRAEPADKQKLVRMLQVRVLQIFCCVQHAPNNSADLAFRSYCHDW